MAHDGAPKSSDISLPLAYPAFVFGLGTLLFYAQALLQWWRPGHISDFVLTGLAIGMLALGAGIAVGLFVRMTRLTLAEFDDQPRGRIIAQAGVTVLGVVCVVAGYSALKPAHLIQEGDFVNYHLALPHQNWLRGDWAAIEWSNFAFIHLVIQYGLSFLWVGLPLLNKFPQYLLVVFLLLQIWAIFKSLRVVRPYFSGLIASLALLAFRGVGIQLGMAMLDLPTLYFLTSVFALLTLGASNKAAASSRILSLALGLSLAAYLGHKSFGVIFFAAIAICLTASLRVVFKQSLRSILSGWRLGYILTPVVLIWSVALARSWYYTGDPFFPVLSIMLGAQCDPSHLTSLTCADVRANSAYLQTVLGNYGYGHDLLALAKAFVFVALAKDGPTPVNNAFDYPLGIFWYVAWMAILAVPLFSKASRRWAFVFSSLACVLFLLWFMGSQQSRWLYPCLLALSLFFGWAISKALTSGSKRVGLGALAALVIMLGCVGVNALRIYRAQRQTFACIGRSCLQYNSNYLADFSFLCPSSEGVLIGTAQDRGYLRCVVRGLDWKKKSF